MPFISIATPKQRLLAQRKIDNGCWLWTGAVKKPTPKKPYLPYGYIHIGSRTDKTARLVTVHRLAASIWLDFDMSNSSIHVLHKCDNPRCFNPKHLFFGTSISNVADRHAKGRDAKMKGEDSPNAKLTEAEVRGIRSLRGKARHWEIAEKFGVSRSAITAILCRRAWKHI